MNRNLLALAIAALVAPIALANDYASVDQYQGKPATDHTRNANKAQAQKLPWQDQTAFEQANRGRIASFDGHAAGEVHSRFNFLEAGKIPDTANPSIYRQAMLNYVSNGLFEVVDGIYQVRGSDLSNMTIIRTNNGYVLYDVLLSDVAARDSWAFARKHLPKINGEHKVTGVIYSHTHADHFGGSRGVIDEQYLANNPGVDIFAPKDFLKELVDENLIGGPAMGRRAQYQYGTTLENSDEGIVDNALGNGTSRGNVTLVPPTRIIEQREELINIDGVDFLFINMPGAEAPAEIVTWLPQYKALWTAELTYHGQHNIYTFRGAKVRDSLAWTKYLTELKVRFAPQAEVLFAAHSAPVWGSENIAEYITLQRDNYGFIHNQSMRLANQGVTIHDVGRELEAIVPQSQLNTWHTNGYHGSYSHNARAVVNMYLGYHDMNPVNTNPLKTQDKSCVYVNAAGEKSLMKAGKKYFDKGNYQAAAQLYNDVVQCKPDNKKARHALADSFEQMGYQSETMAWRNSYLQAAMELRTNTIEPSIRTASSDIVANTPTGMLLDFLAVQLNGPKAEQAGLEMSFNIVHPDLNEVYYAEVSNANMANIMVEKAQAADATLTINKADLTAILLKQKSLESLVASGKASIEGKQDFLQQLLPLLDEFDGQFEIMPLAKTN